MAQTCSAGRLEETEWGNVEFWGPATSVAAALLALRLAVGVLVRQVLPRSEGPLGALGRLFDGLPTPAKQDMFLNKIVSTLHAVLSVAQIGAMLWQSSSRDSSSTAQADAEELEALYLGNGSSASDDAFGGDVLRVADALWARGGADPSLAQLLRWPVYSQCDACVSILVLSLGYFIYDSIDCVWNRTKNWPLVLAHHVFAGPAFYLAIAVQCTTFWAAVFLLMEASTLPLNTRWFIARTSYKGKPISLLAGVALFITFFFCRMVLSGWAFYSAWHARDQFLSVDSRLIAFWVGMFLALFGLNCFWFYTIFTTGMRALSGGGGEKDKITQPTSVPANKKKTQ